MNCPHCAHVIDDESAFCPWCDGRIAGAPTYDSYASRYYPMATPRELGILWVEAFSYLDGSSESARFLVEQFERRIESPIRAGLGDGYTSITKAGWYPSDSGKQYEATADAGIVLDGTHAYVLAIMTDLPDDLPGLASYVEGIWSATKVLH